MPLLSSPLLLRTHALTLLTTSYLLLSSPITLLNASPTWILGEAMHIRPASFQPSLNPLTKHPLPIDERSREVFALLALVIVVVGVGEFVCAGGLTAPGSLTANESGLGGGSGSKRRLGEEVHTLLSSQSTHLTLAFMHVVTSGALVAWIYLFHSTRNILSSTSTLAASNGLGALLGNQVVFSACLMDMLFWGYIWTVIKDERREALQAVQRLKMDEDDD